MAIVPVVQNVEKVRGFFITAVAGATVTISARGDDPAVPATHYADAEGASPSTGTLIADESGKVETYLDTGSYDFYYKAQAADAWTGPTPVEAVDGSATFDPDLLEDGSIHGDKLEDGTVSDAKLENPGGGSGITEGAATSSGGSQVSVPSNGWGSDLQAIGFPPDPGYSNYTCIFGANVEATILEPIVHVGLFQNGTAIYKLRGVGNGGFVCMVGSRTVNVSGSDTISVRVGDETGDLDIRQAFLTILPES